jgi:hypothetical protein
MDAQLSHPSALALQGNDLLIADNGNGRIVRIDTVGRIVTLLGACEEPQASDVTH